MAERSPASIDRHLAAEVRSVLEERISRHEVADLLARIGGE